MWEKLASEAVRHLGPELARRLIDAFKQQSSAQNSSPQAAQMQAIGEGLEVIAGALSAHDRRFDRLDKSVATLAESSASSRAALERAAEKVERAVTDVQSSSRNIEGRLTAATALAALALAVGVANLVIIIMLLMRR